MVWQQLNTEHAESVFRTPVFGGWLIKVVQERARQLPIYEGETVSWRNEEGFEWQTAITFMPDPLHNWDPSVDYSELSKVKKGEPSKYDEEANIGGNA